MQFIYLGNMVGSKAAPVTRLSTWHCPCVCSNRSVCSQWRHFPEPGNKAVFTQGHCLPYLPHLQGQAACFILKYVCVLCCVCFLVTPWTVVHQAPLSMEFSRQECWRGLPFPSPGDLPDLGIEPVFPALTSGFLNTVPPGKSNLAPLEIKQSLFTPEGVWLLDSLTQIATDDFPSWPAADGEVLGPDPPLKGVPHSPPLERERWRPRLSPESLSRQALSWRSILLKGRKEEKPQCRKGPDLFKGPPLLPGPSPQPVGH